MSTKKIISAALTATTSVWLSGAMLVLPVAHAQSAADLQAQINALLATIAALQAQLAGQTGGSMMTSYSFTRDLTLGSTGDDVKALQQWLNSHGAQVSASGAGSSGSESTYFGAKTQAALAKWQAANGVSPAAGYFGPKTRAAVAAMGGTMPPVAGQPPAPGMIPASGLAVSLAAGSPTGSAISGAGQVNVGRFNFTAGMAGSVTVTGLELKKIGVLSDTNINNLYLADAATGEVVAQYQSLTNGLATFSGLTLNVGAGQTWVGELRMDLAVCATCAGNTIQWQLSKVMTSGNATVNGTPSTNTLTITTVSNPSIGTLTLTEVIPGASAVTVDAGTNAVLISSWTANVGNSAVNLTNMQFTFVGSANPSDIRNLKLMVNGAEVATLPQGSTNTNFNFSANPVRLPVGNSVIEIFADVLGSPNRTFRFSLLQPYRVNAVDTQYNTGITTTLTNGSANVTINTGSITVSLASDTPTAAVPAGASNVTLAKFRIYAAGEPVKVKFLRVQLTRTGGDAWSTLANITEDIQNVKVVDDAGGQLGNPINTIGGTTNNNDCGTADPTIICNFGLSSSPVNYVVPANTARTLSVNVDILSTNDSTALRALLPGDTLNLEGQISFQQVSSGAANGATLTVTTQPLSVTANSAFASPVYVTGANEAKIASFVVAASAAQGARITSLTFDKDDAGVIKLQNMKVMYNGTTQFGTTRATISTTAAEASLAFSGATPIQVPAGGSVTIDVYADIITGSATQATVFDLIGWSALGNISNSSIAFPGAVTGQNITVSAGPTLTVAKASETAPTKQVVMGSTGNSIFTVRLTADNVEDIRVTDITFTDTMAGTTATSIASYQNLSLWDGATQVAGPLAMTMPGATTSTVVFNLPGSGVVVPKNGTKNLELKGDVATFSSGGALSNQNHTFAVAATANVTALGKDSNTAATVSGTPTANVSTVYRTKVALSSSLLGASSNRVRTAVDDIANLNFAANSAFQAVLGTVSLKLSGAAVASGSTAFAVDLIDSSTNTALGSAAQATCTPGPGSSCSVTFGPQFIIDSGTTKVTKVRVNSATFTNTASQSDGLSVLVNATTDVLVNDGTTASIPLESTVVPFTVVNVSYE